MRVSVAWSVCVCMRAAAAVVVWNIHVCRLFTFIGLRSFLVDLCCSQVFYDVEYSFDVPAHADGFMNNVRLWILLVQTIYCISSLYFFNIYNIIHFNSFYGGLLIFLLETCSTHLF